MANIEQGIQKLFKNEERWEQWISERKIVSNHTITHPNVCKLIESLFAVSPSIGPLERSYSKLAKIWYKDRNRLTTDHMESL